MRTLLTFATAFLLAFTFHLPAGAQTPSINDVNLRDSAVLERWSQVFDATWPLQQANADLCPEQQAYLPGFLAVGVDDGTGVRVFQVASFSPAQTAGLAEGDFITAINGNPTNHRKASKAGEQFQNAYDKAIKNQGPMELSITRAGTPLQLTIESVKGCDFRVVYTGQPIPTLVQDNIVLVGTVLDRYAANPEQLRMYLARDFAHVLLNHRQQRQKSAGRWNMIGRVAGMATGHSLGGGAGAAIANWKLGPKQDLEADQLGLYLVANAGDDVTHAPAFWTAVFAQHEGGGIASRLLNTHRGTPERLETIQKTTDRILAQKAAGEPLALTVEPNPGS